MNTRVLMATNRKDANKKYSEKKTRDLAKTSTRYVYVRARQDEQCNCFGWDVSKRREEKMVGVDQTATWATGAGALADIELLRVTLALN